MTSCTIHEFGFCILVQYHRNPLNYRVLLVLHRDEPNSGRLEDVEGVHEGAADDAEDVLGAVGDEGLHERLRGGHRGLLGAPGGAEGKAKGIKWLNQRIQLK